MTTKTNPLQLTTSGLVFFVFLLSFVACKQNNVHAPVLQATATGAAIIESSGGHQVGATGTVLKDPLIIQVNDDHGSALPGALVEFHGPAGVHFDPEVMLTDSSGQASSSVTMGSNAGRYLLSATTAGKTQTASVEIVETALGYEQRLGSSIADQHCNRCHDPESSAERVSNYDNLAVKPHPFVDGSTLNKMSDADLMAIVQHGGPALNRSTWMPPYGGTLSKSDVQALIAYIRIMADPPYQPAGMVYARK